MTGGARMFAGVPIRRAVAAQGDAALLTSAEMDPRVADLYTLGAFADVWLLDRIDRIQMRAAAIGHLRLLLFEAASRR